MPRPPPKRGSNFWNWTSVVPIDEKASIVDRLKPVTRATMAMTAATPMMMPSIVSAERSLLTRSAFRATRSAGTR